MNITTELRNATDELPIAHGIFEQRDGGTRRNYELTKQVAMVILA